MITLLAFAKSDIGLVRPINEDSFACISPDFYVVADGMGGHLAGEIASQLAVETIKKIILHNETDSTDFTQLLKHAINTANKEILAKATINDSYNGMGTTVTSVLIKNETVFWGHIGDSRLYLIRNKTLTQLTNDHSLVWELLEQGSINKEEAQNHPQKNVLTRAVGIEETINIETGSLKLFPDDMLLLCTDGLTNMVSTEQLMEAILNEQNLKLVLDSLFETALKAGGTDNITAILVRY